MVVHLFLLREPKGHNLEVLGLLVVFVWAGEMEGGGGVGDGEADLYVQKR